MNMAIDRFRAQSDDGHPFQVIVYQRQVRFRPLSGPSSVRKGSLSWKLADGRDVNQIDDSTYLIVESDLIIRRV